MLARRGGSRAGKSGYDDGALTGRRKGWLKAVNRKLPAGQRLSAACKPRHVVRRFRDGTPAGRKAADRARDSANPNYGTGSTAQAAAEAAAVS